MRGNHTLMFLSLSFSLPPPLSKINKKKFLKADYAKSFLISQPSEETLRQNHKMRTSEGSRTTPPSSVTLGINILNIHMLHFLHLTKREGVIIILTS